MMVKQLCTISALTATLLTAAALPAANRDDAVFDNWKLESSIQSAQLVMVARVAHVSNVRVVEGAKTSTMLREFRFQPVRVLKGIYSRDELSMTGTDLNCAVVDPTSPAPLREGEFRLLVLTQRSGLRSYGCAGTPSAPFEQSVPKLDGPNDPLSDVALAIVRATNSRSRKERTQIIVKQLKKTEGVAVIPLLDALANRGVFAARHPDTADLLVALSKNQSPEIRRSAIRAIESVAKHLTAQHGDERTAYGAALGEFLRREDAGTPERLQAIAALGQLDQTGRDLKWPTELLSDLMKSAATYAERKAAMDSLGQLGDPTSMDEIAVALESLPLDASAEASLIQTAAKLDAARTSRMLIQRIERSWVARQSITNEVTTLGNLKQNDAIPTLLAAAQRRDVSDKGKAAIAVALGKIADERGVELLSNWMRSNSVLRYPAIDALVAIDTQAAAEELRSWLKSEPYIQYKLKIARAIGQHGFGDGYSLAIEHLAEDKMTILASEALKQIDDPRATKELEKILQSQPDGRWLTASLSGLVALGHEPAQQRLMNLLSDDRNPVIHGAIEASRFVDDQQVASLLVRLGTSRNAQLALASLKQLRSRMSEHEDADEQLVSTNQQAAKKPRPELKNESIQALDALIRDSYASANVRIEVLQILNSFGNQTTDQTLAFLADRTDLEGSKLQTQVEQIIREKEIDPT